MRTAIVLAGGRSTRFEGDKLAAELDGRSVLASTLAAVVPVVDGIVVAGPSLPPDWIGPESLPVTLIRDREPFDGPLVALEHVLRPATLGTDALAIVVGGDMPRLVPGVIALLFDALERYPAVEAVLLGRPPAAIDTEVDEPPRRQVLPLAIRVQPAARAAREAVEAGRRSLQALVERMTVIELPAPTWLALDAAANSLLDVDTAADLERVRGAPAQEPPSGP